MFIFTIISPWLSIFADSPTIFSLLTKISLLIYVLSNFTVCVMSWFTSKFSKYLKFKRVIIILFNAISICFTMLTICFWIVVICDYSREESRFNSQLALIIIQSVIAIVLIFLNVLHALVASFYLQKNDATLGDTTSTPTRG